jgi:hypothetical protein
MSLGIVVTKDLNIFVTENYMSVFLKNVPPKDILYHKSPLQLLKQNSHVPTILCAAMSSNLAFNPKETDSSPPSPISTLAFHLVFLYPLSFT